MVIVLGYDHLARRCHIESLTGAPATSAFPSVEDVHILFARHFYTPIYRAKEKNMIYKILLQGYSPTFQAECLDMVPTCACMYDRANIIGGVGYTLAQIKGIALALHGCDLPQNDDILTMLQKFETCLPQHCLSLSEGAIPQIPRKFVHAVLPALRRVDLEEFRLGLSRIQPISPKTHQFLTALAARGMSQWKTEANKLIFDGKAPMALLRYRYADADMASADGLKQVLKPSFKAFTAACYEAGMLTLSRGLPKHYVFPDRMTRLQVSLSSSQESIISFSIIARYGRPTTNRKQGSHDSAAVRWLAQMD